MLVEHNRESRNRSMLYSQLIFDTDAKAIKWGNDQPFQQTVLQELIIHNKKEGRNSTFSSYHVQKFN